MSMYQILALAWSEVEWAVMGGPRSGGLSLNYMLMARIRCETIEIQELQPWQRTIRMRQP